jgi:tRNA (guanine37-N1)-methyltransferase
MQIDVLTLFPELFEPYLAHGIVARAIAEGILGVRCVNFRQFTHDRHRSVDDRPFGGGPGMVLKCEPIFEAVEWLDQDCLSKGQRILLTPQGEPFRQEVAQELANQERLVLLCGQYEGVDERVRIGWGAREISIGDYVLSGGEPAALVVMDAVARLLPGVLGNEQSPTEESFSSGRLEYPHYTRPREFRGMQVPDVLLSGDHGRIARWRLAQSTLRTRLRRPDLLTGNESIGASDRRSSQ